MNVMDIDRDKLQELFIERYRSLGSNNDVWVKYCDRHKIFMLHGRRLADTLNEGKIRGRVCIENCEFDNREYICPWLLVPKKFAEKCLVLGGLP